MSLRIQQLNADTTFFLTFSPSFAPEKTCKRFPGDFTILVDPWLRGTSSVLHPSFQLSHHTSEPEITSLKDLKQNPDLILISQDKPDHCHRETLCSLPGKTDIQILATPAAAKKIRSWKHFDARQVHVMKAYNPADRDSIIRIPLSAYSSSSAPGEITISNMPTKRDMTGLHNAIGITYQPPSTIFTLNNQYNRHRSGSTVSLSEKGISRASSMTKRPQTSGNEPSRPSFLDPLRKTTSIEPPPVPALPTSSQTSISSVPHSRADSGIVRTASSRSNSEKTLSILYTPHGVSPRVLQPYVHSHLDPLNAVPVSVLFHSINTEQNPWFMGGVVAAGAPGGVEIAKAFGARHWVGAHDEYKDNKGLATVWIKSREFGPTRVRELLKRVGQGETRVHRLGVGEVLRIPQLSKDDKRVGGEDGESVNGKLVGEGTRMNVEEQVLAMPEAKRVVDAMHVDGKADMAVKMPRY